MKRLFRICAVALVVIGAPLAASAQNALADDDRSGLISAGAMVGAQLDTPDNWLIFGVDARAQIAHALELSPRFTYQPVPNGHAIQLDVNLLQNFDLAQPGRFRPFVGIGGALRLESAAGFSDNSVGLNLISGTRIAMSPGSGYEPFFIAEYTIVHGQPNDFSLVIGASFRLRH